MQESSSEGEELGTLAPYGSGDNFQLQRAEEEQRRSDRIAEYRERIDELADTPCTSR